ncbi:hypothetical protein KIW84_046346 [Lathyrus oleraceus]|uniref:Helitron helicase-like domain-containing protein n=1 Tax=Pisum sativum TaxID=3888 RepID=A0A9D4XNP8_PEA|nr:hypothetical protein KIW84_046346 [Pisum sativum]
MSNKQRENNLSRRRKNYRRRKEQEKQAQTSRPINSQSRVPFQNFTNITFPRSHFQGAHDSEADPSRITHVNDVALDRNCTSPNQRNNTSQSDTALEDAVISYVNMDAREKGALSRRPQESGHAFRAKHNIARNFKNNMMMAKSRLPHPITCRHCNGRLFHHESRDTCCNGGKVSFSRVNAHIELQQLFLDGSAEGKHFRQHIQSYNHVLSFTSIGVHIDENILASGRGIYTFRAQDSMDYGRDINVIHCDGNLKKVQETKGYYDPLQYPGDYGGLKSTKVIYVLNCTKVYMMLCMLVKLMQNIGKRTILPSPFIDGRRDMTQRHEDGMAIVLNGGKPNIFLTMTCNPSWSEIPSEILPFQTPQDRPDLLIRIFRSKFEKLKDDVIDKGVLGKVKSYMYVTEFQK